MVDLMMNITPRPFWIQFDRYATKITDENKDSVGHGLHLALEFQLAREPNAPTHAPGANEKPLK